MRSLFLPAEQLFCFRPLFFYNLLLSKYKVLFNVFPICGRQQRTLGFWCFCPLQVKWICANVIPMFFLAKKHFEFETKNKCFHATRLEHVWCPCVWFPVFQSSLFALCFSIASAFGPAAATNVFIGFASVLACVLWICTFLYLGHGSQRNMKAPHLLWCLQHVGLPTCRVPWH